MISVSIGSASHPSDVSGELTAPMMPLTVKSYLKLLLILSQLTKSSSQSFAAQTVARIAHHHALLNSNNEARLETCVGVVYEKLVITTASTECASIAFNSSLDKSANRNSHFYTEGFTWGSESEARHANARNFSRHPDYEPATGRRIAQHDIAVFDLPFKFDFPSAFAPSRNFQTDIVYGPFPMENPTAMARITHFQLRFYLEFSTAVPSPFTIYPKDFCVRFFEGRAYDPESMICGRTTNEEPVCYRDLGSAIYYLDEHKVGLTHLLAINIESRERQGCTRNEPSVFLLLYSELDFIEKNMPTQ